MSLIVNHNSIATTAARNLNSAYNALSVSTNRLSSGLRINSAADDAAGLAVRELMRSDISTLNQGVRNANDLYNPLVNIRAGIKYLKQLWDRFTDFSWSQLASFNPFNVQQVKMAVAAYNAGPGAVSRYGTVPPYRETRDYVVKVLRNYVEFRRALPSL